VRHNYLNNRDILKEIHRSKTSYCSFLTKSDADYDIIVNDVTDITPEIIAEGRRLRSERLTRVAYDAAVAIGGKHRLEDHAVSEETIADSDIVFRVMTWEHVPVDDAKSRKAAMKALDEEGIPHTEYDDDDFDLGGDNARYIKINFPPFQHYRLTETGDIVCVGRSHWKGDLESGEFSQDHGKMTNTLAHMFIKLCERYATRSNWRGYTYNEEMRGQALLQLSQVGLKFDESKSANPFAYYTAAITNSFTRVLNIEKRNQNLRDDILEMNNLNPSYTRQNANSYGGGHSSDD
jgi:hypothetical protein